VELIVNRETFFAGVKPTHGESCANFCQPCFAPHSTPQLGVPSGTNPDSQ
jgi:hypothetical protein